MRMVVVVGSGSRSWKGEAGSCSVRNGLIWPQRELQQPSFACQDVELLAWSARVSARDQHCTRKKLVPKKGLKRFFLS